ncbi:unnamed protein product, partial [Didymodactylos carnosus]
QTPQHIRFKDYSFWVTAKHLGLDTATNKYAKIYLNRAEFLRAKCVHASNKSDLALLITPTTFTNGMQKAEFIEKLPPLQTRAHMYGFGTYHHLDLFDPAVVHAVISCEYYCLSKRSPKGASTKRFFIVDRMVDFGFSGGPVLTTDGKVLGMLSMSPYSHDSWALRAKYILKAIKELGIHPVSSKK